MRLLIDLDIFLYKGLFAAPGYYPGIRACDSILTSVLERLDHTSYDVIISGPDNFRKKISPEYKANRKPESKPSYLYEARNYFLKYWNATMAVGEADDLIGSLHDNCSIIVSSDKDFNQVGGKIYNPWKDTVTEITNPDYWFYYQCLVGDVADNIKGITGIGPVKAERLLLDKTKDEMKQIVQDCYIQEFGDGWFARFDLTARLLFIHRKNATEYFEIY
jgi:5'-3' exonuclease